MARRPVSPTVSGRYPSPSLRGPPPALQSICQWFATIVGPEWDSQQGRPHPVQLPAVQVWLELALGTDLDSSCGADWGVFKIDVGWASGRPATLFIN